ncbi:uncharacterized protein ACMZJ9_014317 [Mantella aurantiaca]
MAIWLACLANYEQLGPYCSLMSKTRPTFRRDKGFVLLEMNRLLPYKVPGYTLTYFPVRGRAEAIRLLLADQGASWTDDEVQIGDWMSGKSEVKKAAVFGQLPRFQDGDFVLYQTNAILRYLGRKFGIAGSNEQERAIIDMVNDGVEDLRLKYSRFMFFEYETGKEKYGNELPNHLTHFEKILSKNSDGTKFLVGDKISYADYNLLDLLQCHISVFPDCLSSFPLLKAYIDRIVARSKLSEYLNSDARNSRPILPKRTSQCSSCVLISSTGCYRECVLLPVTEVQKCLVDAALAGGLAVNFKALSFQCFISFRLKVLVYHTCKAAHQSTKANNMSGIVITYFPVRGRVEASRLLLADQGISWKDDEVQMQDWASGKGDLKKNAVFGQLPRLQDGSFVLYQSNTILRYLGRKYGVAGSSEQEIAVVEMVNDGVEDFRMKYYKFLFVENEANKDKYLEELSHQLGYFENILSKNANGTKFLVGDGITYADYDLVDTLQCNLDLSPKCLSAFPLLSAYLERILKRPKLSEYLKSDGRKRRPITPKHK